jgi:HlyD family secretion protein
MAQDGRNGGRRRRVWLSLGIVFGLLVIVLLILSVAMRSDHRIDPSKLAKVEKGDIARSVVATGKIEPLAKVEVKSKASGLVKQIFVDYGDTVRPGEVLVELDKEELQARLREARASLMAAEAAKESAVAQLERNEVEAKGPDVPFLSSALERARKLSAEGVISDSLLDDAQKEYELAVNRQAAAQRAVAVSRGDLARTRAEVAQAQAAVERADQDLRNSTIVSPMEGLVLSRDVEVGDAVSSILVMGSEATRIVTLGDVSSVYVKGKVDESDIGKVYLGQPARIVVESFKDKKLEGKVTKISPLGVEKDNVTSFEVRVSIENPGGALKANMSANAEIILEEKKGVLLVPEAAMIYDKDRKTFLETPDPHAGGGVRKVAVKTGISNGVKTELVEGLKEGDQVVLQ